MIGARRFTVPSVLAGLRASAVVAAVAAAHAAGRAVGLRGNAPDPLAGDRLDFPCDRETVVMADDGVPLTVREVGPADAPVTVVFVHGFTLRAGSWVFVRRELERRWRGPDGEAAVRMVFPDCRGHGDSGACPPERATVRALGADIGTVIDTFVPEGPVVLVGHSMGGMAIFGCAQARPELFGDRVVAVSLLGTAAHGIADAGLASALRNPALDAFRMLVRCLPATVGRGRAALRPLAVPLVTAGAYGPGEHSPTMTDYSSTMSLRVPVGTMAGFMMALETYDQTAVLPVVARTDASVVCGSHDWLTPLRNSKRMALALDCEFIVIHGVGHMLIMEAASQVAASIADLVRRIPADRERAAAPR